MHVIGPTLGVVPVRESRAKDVLAGQASVLAGGVGAVAAQGAWASARFSCGVADSRSPETTGGRSVRVTASVKCRSSVKISSPSERAPNQSDVLPYA
ncbi:MAG: hypothetical protein WAK76_11560, partial [Trebonia sp.]